MSVADNIREIISDYGYKQKSIAEKAGMSEKQFSDLLNGRKTFKAEYLPSICIALNKSPNDVLNYEKER